MEYSNKLSENLKAYQKKRGCSLTEFSRELDISKSTLQSVMKCGNTTLDTLLRLEKALNTSLDDLVHGGGRKAEMQREMLNLISNYEKLPPGDREMFRCYLSRLLDLMDRENG